MRETEAEKKGGREGESLSWFWSETNEFCFYLYDFMQNLHQILGLL